MNSQGAVKLTTNLLITASVLHVGIIQSYGGWYDQHTGGPGDQ